MCGIFGYISEKNGVKKTLEGLKCLEYRGYDSAGIGGFKAGKLYRFVTTHKIDHLSQVVDNQGFEANSIVGHTRWATHGRVSDTNAHPICSSSGKVLVVHNGIVENYEELKKPLENEGVLFSTETDTEVIAELIDRAQHLGPLKAAERVLSQIEGSCAFAFVLKNAPDEIILATTGPRLSIGIAEKALAFSSDSHAFGLEIKQIASLEKGQCARLKKGQAVEAISNKKPFELVFKKLSQKRECANKKSFEHFMLKEIYDTPFVLQRIVKKRFCKREHTFKFDQLQNLKLPSQIELISCGSSWYAAKHAAFLMREHLKIPAQAHPASEFRYEETLLKPGALVIAISQSGETADTLAAAQKALEQNATLLSLCNAPDSQLEEMSDICIHLEAGLEVGVASTKAYTASLLNLWLLILYLKQLQGHTVSDEEIENILLLPQRAEEVLEKREQIAELAKSLSEMQHVFFIGRGLMYPTALEAALKLKEVSYIASSAYPAGEMKHGPIALVDRLCPTLAFVCDESLAKKMQASLAEVKAREGKAVAILPRSLESVLKKHADELFLLPPTAKELIPITAALFSQLFAYYMAYNRGTEIDQPKNLAKSVTVE